LWQNHNISNLKRQRILRGIYWKIVCISFLADEQKNEKSLLASLQSKSEMLTEVTNRIRALMPHIVLGCRVVGEFKTGF